MTGRAALAAGVLLAVPLAWAADGRIARRTWVDVLDARCAAPRAALLAHRSARREPR